MYELVYVVSEETLYTRGGQVMGMGPLDKLALSFIGVVIKVVQ